MIEGVASIAMIFVLFVVLAQTAVAFLARQSAEAVVDAAVRDVAEGALVSDAELRDRLQTGVPATEVIEQQIRVDSGIARGSAILELHPPGPILRPITIRVDSEVPFVVAP